MTTATAHVRPVALVTGASSGIGYEIVKIFAREGYDVVVVARDVDRLEKLAEECRSFGAGATVIAKDLSVLSSAQEIYDTLQSSGIQVDVLVNNAGLGTHGSFISIPMDKDLHLLQVNIVALTQLTKLFLPGMVARGRGRILNVASLAAFQAGPLMATYFASKAYVLYLSEALAQEVAGTGVTVTAFCPGPVRTEFRARAGSEGKPTVGSPMDAETAAWAAYRGMMRGKRIVIPGFKGKLSAAVVRFFPRSWVTWAAGKLNKVD